jgi:Putative Ig domain
MLRASWLFCKRAESNSGLRHFLYLALIAAFSLAATGKLLMASPGAGAPPVPQAAEDACKSCVRVTVSPLSPTIDEGEKLQFSATVTNRRNSAVIWSASAGSITTDGVFTAPKNYTSKAITITAKSVAEGTAKASTAVTVTEARPTISTSRIPDAVDGTAYSANLVARGGKAPYRWTIVSGALPAGLQLASTGAVTGRTTTTGAFQFDVRVTDAASRSDKQSLTLDVSASALDCGPPTYNCSRTDHLVAQLPTLLPDVGNLTGANTMVTDPSFGNQIVRITDFHTDPSAPLSFARTFVTSSSGSADENLWNVDSSLFVLQSDGGAGYPYAFNAANLHATRLYSSSYPSSNGLKLAGGGTWSRVSTNLLYLDAGTTITSYDFTDRTNPPAPQLVYDFTSSPSCLPPGFSVTWKTKGGVSAGDTVFAMAYSNHGNQGSAIYAVAYKVGSGCTMLNTQTGQVTGDFGTSGPANINDRWTIHNVKLSKDGNWLILAATNCLSSSCSKGPYFWQIGTTNVSSCGASGLCSGHWTEGYSHWVNNNNTPLGDQVIRTFANPEPRSITQSFPERIIAPFDQHQSWNNADPADSVPFIASTWSPLNKDFPAAWYNEIIGVASDGSGKVWRFGHSFISSKSEVFSTRYAIGSVSQDGRFFLFSSDWMGTLGSESGDQTCRLATDCRGDVFVLQLN